MKIPPPPAHPPPTTYHTSFGPFPPKILHDKVSHRELQRESERHRLDHALQESRAALNTAVESTASAALAEREAAIRARWERDSRDTAESSAENAEGRAENAEEECAELRDDCGRLGVQLEEACEREGVLRGLVESAEEGRVAAEGDGDAARRGVAQARMELVEGRRLLEEGEAGRRELTREVRGISVDSYCRIFFPR